MTTSKPQWLKDLISKKKPGGKPRGPATAITIKKEAVEAFLAQPKENFEWMKKLAVKSVNRELADLNPKPDFGERDMRLHQKVGFLIGLAYDCFYYQYGMGSGKTRLILELLWYFIMVTRRMKRAIVLVPTDTIASGWGDQIEEWMPEMPYRVLLGSSAEKRHMLAELERGIFVCTYLGFMWLISEMVVVKAKGGKKRKTATGKAKQEMVLSNDLVDDMAASFDCLVADEATAISSRESIFFRALKRMARTVPSRYLLAGRAFGKDPTDTWSQYFVVDRGESLGESIGMFRAAFCIEKKSYFGGPYSFDYKFDPDKTDLLNKFLGNRALHFPTEECIELPPVVRIPKYCIMPEATREYYDAIVKRRRDTDLPPDNNFLRLRQLSAGYLGMRDSRDVKVEVRFPDNPKIDLLLDVMRALPPDHQALIFHEYTLSGKMICEALERYKYKFGWVYGGTSTEEYERDKKKFNRDPNFHFVLNAAKGARGLNLQKANYVIFFETPPDPEMRSNAIHRIQRDGQLRNCFVFDLVMRNTMDERILEEIVKGNNLYKRIMKSPNLMYA